MGNQAALVDIIIPVYNVEAYLPQCLDSVLTQGYPAMSLTLVDDGSTDASGRICDEYAQKDARVRVLHQENQGPSDARNAGLALASGEYVYFLDSDDYIVPGAIETLVRSAEASGADFLFFDGIGFSDGVEAPESARQKYTRKKSYGQDNGPAMMAALRYNMEYSCVPQLLFIRRALLADNHLSFFRGGIVHQDELFTFLLYMHSTLVAHVHEGLLYRRFRPGSIMTTKKSARDFRGYYTVFNEMLAYYRRAVQEGRAPDIAREYIGGIFRGAVTTYLRIPAREKKAVKQEKREMLRSMKTPPMPSGLGSRIQYSNIYFPLIARAFVRVFSPRFRYK